jgi:microcystin-dependent protein
MAPYIGEIRMFAGNFAPSGWMFCEGQILPISENDTLFNLIGTAFGGDGEETFALPDLRGRIPMHAGSGYVYAQSGGVEEVTLTTAQIPNHSHALLASTNQGAASNPQGALLADGLGATLYIEEAPNTPLAATALNPVGGSQPHTNFQPYLCVNFIISLFGLYPVQN